MSNILIIDDEAMIRDTLSIMLETAGHDTMIAEDCDTAIQILSEHAFDLVLCDILLGVKTGMDVLAYITGHHLSCQVVIMTGAPSADTAVAALRHGAYDYLTKPILKKDLMRVSNEALQHKALLDDIHDMESDVTPPKKKSEQNRLATSHRESTEELRHALHAIKQREAKFRAIFDAIQDIYFRADAHGLIRLISPSVENFTGHQPDDLDGKPLTDILDDAQDWQTMLALLHKTGSIHDVEITLCAQGSHKKILCSLNARLLLNDAGEITGVEGELHDITTRKKIELQRIEQTRILEMLASGRPLNDTLEALLSQVENHLHGHAAVVAVDDHHAMDKSVVSINLPDAIVSILGSADARLCGKTCLETKRKKGASGILEFVGFLCPKHDETFLKYGYVAGCNVFIHGVSGDLLGMFLVLFQKEGWGRSGITDTDMLLLQTMARFAGIAMERQRSEAHLWRLSYDDTLTGLPNRRLMKDRLNQALASRKKMGVAVLFMDIDRFKMVNDTLGHHAGDQLLIATAERIKCCVRGTDTVARLGGDEFTIVLVELQNDQDAILAAEKILKSMSEPFVLEGRKMYMSASIGISQGYPGKVAADDLLRHADMAMYHIKEKGNAYYVYSDEISDLVVQRMEIETNLRRAIENKEFKLFYQPQVDIRTGRIVGAEALIRWFPPGQDMIPPGVFIPIAEETGLITRMDQWGMETAIQQNKAWMDMGYDLSISVNLSAQHFHHPDLFSNVKNALKDAGLPPERLHVEVTESMAMKDPEMSVQLLNRICQIGAMISMDDFGTGYSSLAYLKRLPLHVLKIDRAFVCELPDDQEDAAITGMILTLAHQLGLEVVAEGAETLEQLRFLQENQCDIIQGYFFSRPVPAEEMTELLKIYWDVNGEDPTVRIPIKSSKTE